MAAKRKLKSVRLDDELIAAIEARAAQLAGTSNREPDQSAALRDLLRVGIRGTGAADKSGWASGYNDAVHANARDITRAFLACARALERGVSPDRVVETLTGLQAAPPTT